MSIPSQKVSSSNKLIYQRLKQAIDLNLRRQIFIAACDDLCLRDCLAARLQTELAAESAGSDPRSPIHYPRFVSLELDLSDPNPWGSIAAWLTQHPPPQNRGSYSPLPAFQILGAEHLTRHSAAVQWSFLSYLRDIEAHLQMCESTVLLWVSRPWLSSIEHSAPEFWHWRTGVFEFEGEPTPAKGDFGHFDDFGNSGDLRNLRDKGDFDNQLLIPSLSGKSPIPDEQSPIPDEQSPISYPPSPAPDSKSVQLTEDEQSPISHPPSPAPDSKSVQLADLVLAAASEELEAENDAASEDNFLPLQTLQYIELLQEHQCSCEALALAYHSLGNYYRDRILGGDVSEHNLTIAIRAIEQVIAYLEVDTNSQQNQPLTEECARLIAQLTQNLTQYAQESNSLPPISDLLNDLGTLYWMLSRDRTNALNASDPVSSLERSIALYLEGLNRTDGETVPQTRVRLNKNLGIASADLARYRDKTENLQHAVAAYQQALLDLDPAVEPQQYAAAQNNLATAYWNLAQDGEPIVYLKSAIAAYTQALSCYSPEREPLNYAGVQNNLGTACWNLAQHEPSEPLLVRAISAYREALKYRTRELVPAAAAATYNNLGTAYWHLANQFQQKQARTESLQQAITAYETALDIAGELDRTQLTFDALAARNNLGLAHYQLATDPHFPANKVAQTSHLEAALHHQLQVCAEWGQHLNDKGLTYGDKLNLQAAANSQAADSRQTALSYIVKTIRAFYSECGLPGQNLALSKVPGDLLPEILRRL
ncbi:tetratricopeptide repeat protein [Microcoleus vaginatus]|uniref:tetratricopeptide repeat protein n=1 Tax=Microcoleus vaginatus TaxID=119532 RepID=UPI0016889420|nr:tetratricopeptide repeat protein [Microcoleus sp. FACHB-84]MBD2011005.1 tetratricopeptide repeat protein [Microcoleus sp. FACHB-45]